jgi:hypothetical protein
MSEHSPGFIAAYHYRQAVRDATALCKTRCKTIMRAHDYPAGLLSGECERLLGSMWRLWARDIKTAGAKLTEARQ